MEQKYFEVKVEKFVISEAQTPQLFFKYSHDSQKPF